MSCKKGGFITIRHNDLRDLTANLLTEVCKDVDIEPQLLPVTGETFENRTTNISNEARVNIKSRGSWVRDQQAFFDVRVFDPNANWYLNKALPRCYITPLYSQFIGVWKENVEPVCNFQSIKTPVELNSLLSKVFCYITWFVIFNPLKLPWN